jgi:hypothetical protein
MEKNNMAINFLFVSAVKKLYPATMRSDMKEKSIWVKLRFISFSPFPSDIFYELWLELTLM